VSTSRSGRVRCSAAWAERRGQDPTVEILEGFRARTGGTVTVLGLDPAAQPAELRERIGIVLQECGFPRQARVGELIDICGSTTRIRGRLATCSR